MAKFIIRITERRFLKISFRLQSAVPWQNITDGNVSHETEKSLLAAFLLQW